MHPTYTLTSRQLALAAVSIAALAALNIVLDIQCRSGWELALCVPEGFTLYPPFGSGELLLCEVLSVSLLLFGATLSLLSYLHGRASQVRISVVFLMLFIAAYVGENNLMRDDLRPQFMVVLLMWLGIELLLQRAFLPIGLLLVGTVVGFSGTLADASSHAVFQNYFQIEVEDSAVSSLDHAFGQFEEAMEMLCWAFFVLAAITALDLGVPQRKAGQFFVLAITAVIAIAVGVSFLHIRDNDLLEAARKSGFFLTLAGIAIAARLAFSRYSSRDIATRACCVLFVFALFWLCLYVPSTFRGEHSKTVSSWLWAMPLLGMHYFLVSSARLAAGRPTSRPDNRCRA